MILYPFLCKYGAIINLINKIALNYLYLNIFYLEHIIFIMSPIDNKNYLIPDVLMNEINDLDNPNSIEMYEINLEDSKNLSTDTELTGNLMKIYEESVNSNVIIASNNVVDKFKIKEIGSMYIFTMFYCLLEKILLNKNKK